MRAKDPYETLGLPGAASGEDIKKAYRKLVRSHHPDTNPDDPRAEERFKEIQEAYEILSDPRRRKAYDERARATGERPGRAAFSGDLSDLLARLRGRSRVRAGEGDTWEMSGEDVVRVLKALGVSRAANLRGRNVETKVNIRFDRLRSGRQNIDEDASRRDPPWDTPEKPPKPPKPPKWE
jgi:molecular chaperone DnaJ